MTTLDRRTFLTASAATTAGFVMPRFAIGRSRNVNGELRVAVAGIRGRGQNHMDGFTRLDGARVVALCDVDRDVLRERVGGMKKAGHEVEGVVDYRELLDRKDIDAVSLATPNHWHALQTIWACQAGKHVYVEKPVSHNVWEGVQMVAAARKYDRVVQTGTQCRSSQGIAEGIAWVQEGNLGKITLARGLCYKPRKSIGKVEGPQKPPAAVDYDLWVGPAPMNPLSRRNLHYDWHWVFDTGNGDLGNQGIHQMDLCRWAIGADELPKGVFAFGGRYGYDDDGNTPNTLVSFLDYGDTPIMFEVRGLPTDKAAQESNWAMDAYKGARIGAIIHCEGGELRIPNYNSATAFDNDGKELKKWSGSRNHFENFANAVKNGGAQDLTADINEGHLSSALCHLGNVSYLTKHGSAQRMDVPESLLDAVGRVNRHLERNGVADADLGYGAWLDVDPKSGRFTASADGSEETLARANALYRRPDRAPFVVPELA